jgi:uncharacterized protein
VTFALLVLAGVGAGLIGSIAGLASLVSYPALLAVGLAPVTANVTNTVALVFSSIGSISASRPELAGQRRRLRRLLPVSILGGVVGGLLVLFTPSHAFERIVPILIGLSSIGVLVQRRPAALRAHHEQQAPDARWLSPAAFGIGVYGGYFGAAAGVLLLAVVLFATGETLPRSNAVKNVVLGAANAVAALAFALLGHVAWLSALPLAIGCLIGGRLGPAIVRRTPARHLRMMIATAGVGLAIYLAVGVYT